MTIIVEISGTIEFSPDDPSGLESIRDHFEAAIEDTATQWGSIVSNDIGVKVEDAE